MTTFTPETGAEVATIIGDAHAAKRKLELVGSGSRLGLGRAARADDRLDLSKLAGIVQYDAPELVLTVLPGTPVATIKALLREKGQFLAFEPGDMAPLWGGKPGAGTIGGALATGLGGPRRFLAGAPRDHFLGFKAVNGLGQPFAAGGKVIKNVTGYDLPKLMAGAYGTLAAFTEVTLKVMPKPAFETTLLLPGLGDGEAIRALTTALQSTAAISGAAHLPDGWNGLGAGPLTAIRIDGIDVSVRERARYLGGILPSGNAIEGEESAALWRAIGAVHPFAREGEQVWRIVLPRTRAAELVAALKEKIACRALYDWGGSLLWLVVDDAEDAHAATIRAGLSALDSDGHAMLVRGSAEARAAIDVMQPLEPGLAALSARMKARFDPDGILNPGRMYKEF